MSPTARDMQWSSRRSAAELRIMRIRSDGAGIRDFASCAFAPMEVSSASQQPHTKCNGAAADNRWAAANADPFELRYVQGLSSCKCAPIAFIFSNVLATGDVPWSCRQSAGALRITRVRSAYALKKLNLNMCQLRAIFKCVVAHEQLSCGSCGPAAVELAEQVAVRLFFGCRHC